MLPFERGDVNPGSDVSMDVRRRADLRSPIRPVNMNWVQLDADIRGPGEAELRSEVEALIASFSFDASPAPLSTQGLQ